MFLSAFNQFTHLFSGIRQLQMPNTKNINDNPNNMMIGFICNQIGSKDSNSPNSIEKGKQPWSHFPFNSSLSYHQKFVSIIFFPVLSVMAISDFRACSTICPVEHKLLTYNKLRIYVRSKLTGQLLATIYLSTISIQRTGRQVQLNGAFSWTSFKVILRGRGGTFFALIDVNCLITNFYDETHTSMSFVFYESIRICTAYCSRQS